MSPFVALLLSYVIGSIPSAWLAGKAKGVDLRKHGSGNLGATNVYRVLGAGVAAVVFLADVLKGALPVMLLPRLLTGAGPMAAHWAYAFGLAAILGHVRPVFLLWQKGGKGVATATGVFFALAAAVTVFVFWSHRANIGRLRRGEEHRFGRKARDGGGSPTDAAAAAPPPAPQEGR